MFLAQAVVLPALCAGRTGYPRGFGCNLIGIFGPGKRHFAPPGSAFRLVRAPHKVAPAPDTSTTPRTLPTGKSVERWKSAISRERVTPAVATSTTKSAEVASIVLSGSNGSLGPSITIV